MEVMGRPLLSYQIEQLRFSKRIDEIIIATTANKDDDLIAEFSAKAGVKVFRGSENDVLDRFFQAAKKYNAEHIMRLTADCPLIQPDICDKIASLYFELGCDYVKTGQTFAEGLDCEIFSFNALERAWKDAQLKSEREHATLYFNNQPELFKIKTAENKTDDSRYRITVDVVEDYVVVKAIIKDLYNGNDDYIRIEEIKAFLESNPKVFAVNKCVTRNEGLLKSLDEDALTRTS